jgi:hypothetical protein
VDEFKVSNSHVTGFGQVWAGSLIFNNRQFWAFEKSESKNHWFWVSKNPVVLGLPPDGMMCFSPSESQNADCILLIGVNLCWLCP